MLFKFSIHKIIIIIIIINVVHYAYQIMDINTLTLSKMKINNIEISVFGHVGTLVWLFIMNNK